MNGIENAQHDLVDAKFSVETAIELLTNIQHDQKELNELLEVIRKLTQIKGELEKSYEQLNAVHPKLTH